MEIAAIPEMTPPAIAPAFERCSPTGKDVPVFEDPVVDDLVVDDPVVEAETDTDGPDALSTVPGPISGESMEVRRGRETATGVIKGNSHHQWHMIC
jgi:hypothetical protein